MIRSMTGFGKSQAELAGRAISVEIRSLNSKSLDLNLRLPFEYREKEMDIRALLAQRLERGKIDLSLLIETLAEDTAVTINRGVALTYYRQLKGLADEMPEAALKDLIPLIIRMPEVLKSEKNILDESEWQQVLASINQALDLLDRFRAGEGQIMRDDMLFRLNRILELLKAVEPYENQRVEAFRTRFIAQLEELLPGQPYDANRLEQELIYYFEKLDITEEKIRLRKHCEYFAESMEERESPGKKLGFIAQEIGREINTLGSKAYDAQIQRLVVQMKDELEKIKEQLANIL